MREVPQDRGGIAYKEGLCQRHAGSSQPSSGSVPAGYWDREPRGAKTRSNVSTGPTCPLGQVHSGAPVERRVSDGAARRARVAGLGSAGAAVDVLVDPDAGSGSAERCQPGRVQPGCFIRQWSPGRTDDLDELA